MFGRYALALGRGAHRHELDCRAASLDLPVRVETSEMLLVAAAGTDWLARDRSILVGQLFSAAAERLAALPPAMATKLAASPCGSALEGHWGNFALFHASGDDALIYREPSGAVPVYRCGDQDRTFFVSDARIALGLGLLGRPEPDPTFLVHWLQFPFLRTRRTGLDGITELLPGMLLCKSRAGGWRESCAWHPSRFIGRDGMIPDPIEAASRLRETCNAAIPAQAVAPGIALRLSGGLDSSIIAACLAGAGHSFPCINFATRSRDGDERPYAREVADKFRLKLIEVGECGEPFLEAVTRPSFRPLINPLLAPFERAIEQAAGELRASLLVDGGGGDNLFCSLASAAPAIDALLRAGPRTAAEAVADISARAGCSIWEVLTAIARRSWKRRSAWKEDRSFLRPAMLLRRPELHPWLEHLPALPGKREHVEAIVHIHHFLDRAASPTELLHPLLAQPLLELCLSIPSWCWVRGGRDRAVARDAFAGLVPQSVLDRRVKGSLQGLLYRFFSGLRQEMRELLVAGELARAGIIDAAAVEEALTGEAWTTDEVQLRISEMVALESWLRSWRPPPAAASTGS